MTGGPFHPLHSQILDVVSVLSPVVLFRVYIWFLSSENIYKPKVSKSATNKSRRGVEDLENISSVRDKYSARLHCPQISVPDNCGYLNEKQAFDIIIIIEDLFHHCDQHKQFTKHNQLCFYLLSLLPNHLFMFLFILFYFILHVLSSSPSSILW